MKNKILKFIVYIVFVFGYFSLYSHTSAMQTLIRSSIYDNPIKMNICKRYNYIYHNINNICNIKKGFEVSKELNTMEDSPSILRFSDINLRSKKTAHINKEINNLVYLDQKTKNYFIESFKKIKLNPYIDYNLITENIKYNVLTNSHEFLENLRFNTAHSPITLIQNMPIDEELIATPLFDETPLNKGQVSEFSLLLVSSALFALPYINEDEKNNNIIHNVIPIAGKEQELSGLGSERTFNWHTENIHEENPADYLILLALRGDKNAYTSVMLVEDIVKTLPQDIIEKLLSTNFIMKTGPSYNKEKYNIKSILEKDENNNFNMYYNSDNQRCVALEPFGKELYNYLQDHISENVPYYSISLKSGETLVLNNKKALHKRDGFKVSTTEEKRRWLQRIYLKKKLYQ